jgi:tight adherence protein B
MTGLPLFEEILSDPVAFSLVVGTLGLFFVVIAIASFAGDRERNHLRRRLERIKRAGKGMPAPAEAVINVRRSDAYSSIPAFDRLIKRLLPRPEALRHRLARTGLKISLGNYIVSWFVIAAIGFGGAMWTGMIPLPAGVLVGVFFGLALPHLVTAFLIKRRRNKFIGNFAEAIDLMVRGLKSGLPIGESMKTVGEEIPDPVGVEFRQVTDAVRLGQKLEDVLWEAAKRLDIPEFNFFTVSLSIQSETGGNLAETLANLSDVLRRRRQLKLKIKALSSEAKASAYIIGSLPFIMCGLIYMMNAEYMTKLFIDPRGHMMIAVGFAMYAMGMGVMYKMVRFEV